jgi:hypothetical protein
MIVVAAMLLVGCRSEPSRSDLPPIAIRPDTATPTPAIIPALSSQVTHSSNLAGTWELDSDPRSASPTRMRLVLRVDSVVSGTVHGGLVRYFAGNVGSDASDFPEFRGTAFADTAFAIAIWPAGMPNAGFTFRGRLAPDTLHLDTFVVGPDTLSGGASRWMLTRAAPR